MKSKNQQPDTIIAGRSVPVGLIADTVSSIKDKLAKVKLNRCLTIWSKIKQGKDEEKLEINDGLWSAVRAAFDESLSCSLVKFLSSFICQTGSFELSKSFFLFNLSAASDQKKFFLHESLLE